MNYIILSLKHSEENEPTFWKADDAGYTTNPFAAGAYTEEQVKAKEDYYNNGYDTLAIPLKYDAFEKIGFQCTFDRELTRKHIKANAHKLI